MPEKSGMFDSTADDPREYAARDFAEYFGRLLTNGVFNAGQYLNVSATGQDANVSLSPGAAWINGYAYSVYDAPITLPIQPAAAQDRIDRVILRLDTSTPVRAIKAIILQGLPGSSPTPPALVRSGNIYDISLARILIKANTSIVLPANITDERLDTNLCGLVNSLVKVDTTKFQQDFNDFMASLQNQGFATPAFVNQRVSKGDYGVTTNSANAYAVTLNPAPALVEGMRVTVKINAANTGSATLNVNSLGAKTIKKGNGNTLSSGNLKVGSIYTLVYDGTSAFILQGEGGEYGTATADDVLIGKTLGTEDGVIPGKLSPGKKYASGVAMSSAKTIPVTDKKGVIVNRGYVNVTGLSFRPNRIILRPTSNAQTQLQVSYNASVRNATPTETGSQFNLSYENYNDTEGSVLLVYEYTGTTNRVDKLCVFDTGFTLSSYTTLNSEWFWEAFGV